MNSSENMNAEVQQEEVQAENEKETVETQQTNPVENQNSDNTAETQECEESAEVKELKEKLAKSREEADSYLDKLRRNAAEFDNYRKRTEKEKENERLNGALSVLNTVLLMVDNLERGVASIPEAEAESGTAKGLKMVYQQVTEGLKNIGVTEIPALGEQFDPNRHNAVMHIEDEKIDENTVCEVFQKGYEYKGRIIRYSMVKVAN